MTSNPNQDLKRILQAGSFAADKHRDQRRKDAGATPYINHPLALATLLTNDGGIVDSDVLCAALLHDTIEDTNTTQTELTQVFGQVVASMVAEVTDDKSLDKQVRKQRQIEHAPHLSDGAKLVKLADKICNLRDIIASPPADWSLDRRQAYFDWCAQVIAGVRGIHPALEAIFDDLYSRRSELC